MRILQSLQKRRTENPQENVAAVETSAMQVVMSMPELTTRIASTSSSINLFLTNRYLYTTSEPARAEYLQLRVRAWEHRSKSMPLRTGDEALFPLIEGTRLLRKAMPKEMLEQWLFNWARRAPYEPGTDHAITAFKSLVEMSRSFAPERKTAFLIELTPAINKLQHLKTKAFGWGVAWAVMFDEIKTLPVDDMASVLTGLVEQIRQSSDNFIEPRDERKHIKLNRFERVLKFTKRCDMSEQDKVLVYASLGKCIRSLSGLKDQLRGFRTWFKEIQRLPPQYMPEMEQSIRDAIAVQIAREEEDRGFHEGWHRNLDIFSKVVTEAFQKKRDARKNRE
ncbi:MAG: hypothetical protein JWQ23_361 [Herminiimonas sp.]|nr:hypothetical protein [Herminiimonas sp.]